MAHNLILKSCNAESDWNVDFYFGNANYGDVNTARLARIGQCFNIFTLKIDKTGLGSSAVIASDQNEINCGSRL